MSWMNSLYPGGMGARPGPTAGTYVGTDEARRFLDQEAGTAAEQPEDQFAPGAYWSDPRWPEFVVREKPTDLKSVKCYNSQWEAASAWSVGSINATNAEHFRTYRGNIATAVERFLVALTDAAMCDAHELVTYTAIGHEIFKEQIREADKQIAKAMRATFGGVPLPLSGQTIFESGGWGERRPVCAESRADGAALRNSHDTFRATVTAELSKLAPLAKVVTDMGRNLGTTDRAAAPMLIAWIEFTPTVRDVFKQPWREPVNVTEFRSWVYRRLSLVGAAALGGSK